MKFLVFIISLIFLLQGHTTTLLSDLFTHDKVTTSSSCHDESSEPQSKVDDCTDCFHLHICCHVKLIQSNINYVFSPSFSINSYQDFFLQFSQTPVLEGPFQPPKLT